MASRTLITGATGFIGTALARRIAAGGGTVRALVRASSRIDVLQQLGAEMLEGDLGSPDRLAKAVEGCDRVIHVAGVVKALEGRDYFRYNTDGTRNVAAACAAAARPPVLVFVSSLSAAGPALEGRPRTEEDPPAPVSLYGESKLAAERAVRAFAGKIEASIVRPPIVYGPGDHELVPQLVRMAKLGLVVRAGFGQKRYSVVHVDDLCQGILAIAERGQRVGASGNEGVYFLEDGIEYTWDDIARAACKAWGTRALVVPLPEVVGLLVAAGSSIATAFTRKPSILCPDKMREIRQPAWTCSSERARRELGWTPRFPLAEGMREAVNWLRAHQAA